MDNEEKLNQACSEGKPSESKSGLDSSSSNQKESMPSVVSTTDKNNDPSTESETKVSGESEKAALAKSNKVLAFLKSKVGIFILAAILIVGILAVVFINKYNNEKNYEKKLKEFVIESGKSSMASAYICDDLRSIWSDYIFKDKHYFNQNTGKIGDDWVGVWNEYCSNFSEAVNNKIKWNNKNLPSELTEPYRTAKRLYKEMTPPPSKYKEIHTYVKQMFKAMERLHELSENPKGNLSAFSTDCNAAVNDYTSALSDLTNESEIDFSKVDTDPD